MYQSVHVYMIIIRSLAVHALFFCARIFSAFLSFFWLVRLWLVTVAPCCLLGRENRMAMPRADCFDVLSIRRVICCGWRSCVSWLLLSFFLLLAVLLLFIFCFCFALASIHSHLLLARDCVSPFVLARLDFTHEWLKLHTYRILSTLCSSCLCYAILLLLLF